MHLSFLSLLLLTPTLILADGASILSALSLIFNATIALNTTVSSFPSNPLLALGDIAPLLIDSVALLNDINKSTGVAQKSANLTLTEAISVAQGTIALAGVVESTLGNIVATKPKFDELLIVSPVILLNLKLEKNATDKFAAAVISKVPTALQATAQGLITPIDNAFASTIAVYE